MKDLTPKERILCTLNLEKPDRIPVDLGSAKNLSSQKGVKIDFGPRGIEILEISI